jgi:hypothetical protein
VKQVEKGFLIVMDKLPETFRKWYESRNRELQGMVALFIITLLEATINTSLTRITLQEAGVLGNLPSLMSFSLSPVLVILLIVAIFAWALDRDYLFRAVTFIYAGIFTVHLVLSIAGLVITLPIRNGQFGPTSLLRDAFLVWITNVLIFTVWYWMLDRGGPEKRFWGVPERADFTFPQQRSNMTGWEHWKPKFMDYLFLAFIISTNFSVPDSEVLSHRSKFLVMIQISNSLVTLGMVVARAISIIGS